MKSFDPAKMSKAERHQLVIGAVVPRPIAWVTTMGESGVVNLAPFSYFMGVSASPPSVAVSIGHREPPKDTLANLRSQGEAVVHLVPPQALETVNQTGAEYAPSVSEVEALDLETTPSERVAPPRLALANVALECRLLREIPVAEQGSTLCLLEIILAHVDEAVARPDGLPDPQKHSAVARLGGRSYLRADSWDVVELERPQPPEGMGR